MLILFMILVFISDCTDFGLASHIGSVPENHSVLSRTSCGSAASSLPNRAGVISHALPAQGSIARKLTDLIVPAAHASDFPKAESATAKKLQPAGSIASKVTGFVSQISQKLESNQVLANVRNQLAAMPAHQSLGILTGAAISGAVLSIASGRHTSPHGGGLFRRRRAPPPPSDDDDGCFSRGGNLTNWILDVESRFIDTFRSPFSLNLRQLTAMRLLVPLAVASLSVLEILTLASHDSLLLQASHSNPCSAPILPACLYESSDAALTRGRAAAGGRHGRPRLHGPAPHSLPGRHHSRRVRIRIRRRTVGQRP
jgi:hypothetical protein